MRVGQNTIGMKIQKGEVYTVNLIERDTTGKEMGKKRPGIVVQDDAWDSNSPTTIVIPLTSSRPHYYSAVTVAFRTGEAGLSKDSTVVFREIRSVDKSRIGKRLGKVSATKMTEIDRVLSLILGLTPLG